MSLDWFRMYCEFATDTKVQSMDETLQRRFVMFLCLHCAGEFDQLSDDELAFALRISPDELVRTKDVFKQKRFLDSDGKIRSWNKRQFKSDSSTERVREHRERRRNADETLQERPQIQTQIQRQTQKEEDISAAAPPNRVKVSRVAVPADWFLDFKLAYPDRDGDQRWRAAQQAANARFSEGHTPGQLIDGAKRYAAWCRAKGKVGTEGVKQAATFLGPEKSFLLGWTVGPESHPVAHEDREASTLRKLSDRRESIGLAGFRDPRHDETADQYRKAQDDEWNRRKAATPRVLDGKSLADALPTFGSGRA